MSVMIETRGVTHYYGVFVAVQNISFHIPAHQVVALLGPNGAGKTTLLRILTGYLTPSAGTAWIAGLDVQRARRATAARVGYLPENGPLYLDMTPLELLRFFGEARGLGAARLRERIDTVIQQCSLQQVADKPIGKLSKGLRQRAGLAQALLHDPDVLIVDEPTAGLDPNQVRQFRILVSQLRQSKTLLISTHALTEVTAIADRVLLINDGQLIFDGGPDRLSAGGSLENAFYQLTHGAGGEGGSQPSSTAFLEFPLARRP